MKNLTQEQGELYYQNIKTMIMVDNGYDEDDMDDDGIEDSVNREADRLFYTVFKEKK